MSDLDIILDEPLTIQLKGMETYTRRYDAIVLIVAGMHFSCDLKSGPGGDRQIRIIKKLAARAGVEISTYGELQERLEAVKGSTHE